MKVALVLEAWEEGGTEAYVERVGVALRNEGYCMFVLLLSGEEPKLEWAQYVATVEGKGIRKYYNLKNILSKLDPDLVHLNLYVSNLPVILSLKCVSKRPIVATWHSPIYAWNWVHRLGQKWALSLASAAIGGSAQTAQEMQQWRKDSVAISPAISVPKIQRQNSKNEDCFKIDGCGRLSSEKDWSILVKAVKQLCDTLELDICCEIIGGGAEQVALTELVQELELEESVALLGALDYPLAMQRIVEADVFVLPSKFEGFGMAAVEAMALGVPTITSDFPASHEYLKDGETGSHFPIGDAEALAEKLIWHAEHPDESAAMGVRGKKIVASRYAPEVIAQKHVAVYQALCGSSV